MNVGLTEFLALHSALLECADLEKCSMEEASFLLAQELRQYSGPVELRKQ